MIPRVPRIKTEVFVGEVAEETEDECSWVWRLDVDKIETFSDFPRPHYTFLHLKCVSFFEHTQTRVRTHTLIRVGVKLGWVCKGRHWMRGWGEYGQNTSKIWVKNLKNKRHYI